MEALEQILSEETCAKLRKLVELDPRMVDYIWFFNLCAQLLVSTQYGAGLVPLDTLDDVARFKFIALDIAALEVGRLLSERWDKDADGRLLNFIFNRGYRISGDYARRKLAIIAAGKEPLLWRISQRIAEKRPMLPPE